MTAEPASKKPVFEELKLEPLKLIDVEAQSKTSDNSAALSTVSSAVNIGGNYLVANLKSVASWIWSLRAPIFLLGAFALQPKLILLWVLIVLAKPIATWLYRHCPLSWKARFNNAMPARLKNSTMLRDFGEGADQGLPFILFWMYLFCAPFAIGWIIIDWVKGFLPSPTNQRHESGFLFTQNKRIDSGHSEHNFYYSRAFAIVLLGFFVLGIPALVSYGIYESTGIDKMFKQQVTPTVMANTSAPPKPTSPRLGLANTTTIPYAKMNGAFFNSPTGADSTAVMGYNGYWPWIRNLGVEPTKFSVFFVHFYLVSLASVLCILFFRAWFLFPLNFLSDEHDVLLTEFGIKRSLMKSWFLSVITVNRWAIGGGADSLTWQEVKSLRRMEEGYFRLSPLPETAFKRETITYKILNKVASLIDGISHRPNAGNYLIFSSADVDKKADYGSHIKINLNDLSREQRAKLFYSVKKWAPHAEIDKAAEEQLLGSTVLRDNRYTQLWFDMLTTRTNRRRTNVLPSGDILKEGAYIIDNRLSSGGQATTYLATRQSGDKCALKEFILSTSSTSGALIESAREFEAEVSLLSQLNHPGIVRIENFFSEDGRLYVDLEYIEGQSLRQKVQSEGPLNEGEVIRIALSICEVLEYLHGCNPPIVHRDITPENILVDKNGAIKIIDFSLAVRQDGRQTTDSCAKQAFTPPEQFREEVCVQSDLYALGATLFFLLTGSTPKPISSSSPKSKAAHVSLGLNAIVERATQLDLNQRYESVQWLKVDLANLEVKEEIKNLVRKQPSKVNSKPSPKLEITKRRPRPARFL